MATIPRSNVCTVATFEKQLVNPELALGDETEEVVELPPLPEEEEEAVVVGFEATGVPVTVCPSVGIKLLAFKALII